MPRLTKIYTKKGDKGTTALGGGQRVPKDDLRVEAYGTVDELNSQLGVALAVGLCPRLQMLLPGIQNELFDLGSDLCFYEEDKVKVQLPEIGPQQIKTLEKLIDELLAIVGPLQNFILPGGHPTVSVCHVCRTVCRRAERLAVALHESEPVEATYVLAADYRD
ncbi:MAG TPA: cob(I)yrinic acid a,c-diamide adenosyltransferase, partial [Caldilineaceae bacterium]|nr:cob(I)yrinic acid a,c-diamide adenosyltransferase [Caldilineaceae bacterium]